MTSDLIEAFALFAFIPGIMMTGLGAYALSEHNAHPERLGPVLIAPVIIPGVFALAFGVVVTAQSMTKTPLIKKGDKK